MPHPNLVGQVYKYLHTRMRKAKFHVAYKLIYNFITLYWTWSMCAKLLWSIAF